MISDKNSFLAAFVLALVAAGFAGAWACNAALFSAEELEAAILRVFMPAMIVMGIVVIRIVMVLRGRNEFHLIFDIARNLQSLPRELQFGMWLIVLPIGTAISFAMAAAFCLEMG